MHCLQWQYPPEHLRLKVSGPLFETHINSCVACSPCAFLTFPVSARVDTLLHLSYTCIISIMSMSLSAVP